MASAQAFIDGIEAATLECPLCMERFKNPKILPCIHSFCLSCLEEWMKKNDGILSCPTCREVCPVPSGGLPNLRNNIYIIGLLDYLNTIGKKSVPICCICSTEASSFCQNCDELYCKTCGNVHTNMKMSKHHTLITVKEYMNIDPVERLASKSVYCCEHNMPMQFFCDKCKIPVCVGCTLIEHPTASHNIKEIKNAFETFTKQSEKLLKETDEKLLKFNAMATQMKEQDKMAKANYTKCKMDIERQAKELHRLIDTQKLDQLQKLDCSHQNDLKSLASQLTDVEFTIANLSSMRDITDKLMISPNHVMALMSSSDVSKRLELLLEKTDPTTKKNKAGGSEYDYHTKMCRNIEGQLQDISPEQTKLTIVYKHPQSMRKMLQYVKKDPQELHVTTKNALGTPLYFVETDVICLRTECVVDASTKTRKCSRLGITNGHNGFYKIHNGEIPLQSCALVCLIFIRSDVYASTCKFDSFGNSSQCESPFKLLK